KSASSKTIYASLPPNSNTHFFKTEPAFSATFFPASVLPVKVTALTSGCSMILPTFLPETNKVVKTFSGKPASNTNSSISKAQPLTLDACFKTPQLPAIKLGAKNLKTCQNGKFQGIIAKITPK